MSEFYDIGFPAGVQYVLRPHRRGTDGGRVRIIDVNIARSILPSYIASSIAIVNGTCSGHAPRLPLQPNNGDYLDSGERKFSL